MKIEKISPISLFGALGLPFIYRDGDKYAIKRVMYDSYSKYNTLIVYEETDEIYEHYDGMLTWED